MITCTTPTTAIEIVKHIAAGGRCIIRVIPQRYMTVTCPRDVEQVRQDRNGEWWFGVQLWAFQWFQFPAVGLEWTLVTNECETPKSWSAAKNFPAGGQDRCVPVGAGDASPEGSADGSQRGNCEDAARDQSRIA